jgi:hypothetical protein
VDVIRTLDDVLAQTVACSQQVKQQMNLQAVTSGDVSRHACFVMGAAGASLAAPTQKCHKCESLKPLLAIMQKVSTGPAAVIIDRLLVGY